MILVFGQEPNQGPEPDEEAQEVHSIGLNDGTGWGRKGGSRSPGGRGPPSWWATHSRSVYTASVSASPSTHSWRAAVTPQPPPQLCR